MPSDYDALRYFSDLIVRQEVNKSMGEMCFMHNDGVFSLTHERKIKEMSERLAAREWEIKQAERRCLQWQWAAYTMFGCALVILILAVLSQEGVIG